jgi:FkbM family methyltransferase
MKLKRLAQRSFWHLRVYQLLNRISRPVLGKEAYQESFGALYRLALIGMNYGGGTNVNDSGERAALEHVKKLLRGYTSSLVLFDVGANQGEYANLLLKTFGTVASVHCFEPSPATFAMLERNVDRAVLHNYGLGDSEGILILNSDGEGSGLASLYNRNLKHIRIKLSHTEQVRITTVDDFCQSNGIDRIHLLKLDVEGYELKVLEGASRLLAARAIDFIQFEFGGCNIDSRTYFRDFFDMLAPQYSVYRVVKDGLKEIISYSETLEVFTTTNYLCELRR